jgi:hypothetical protein
MNAYIMQSDKRNVNITIVIYDIEKYNSQIELTKHVAKRAINHFSVCFAPCEGNCELKCKNKTRTAEKYVPENSTISRLHKSYLVIKPFLLFSAK